MAVAFGAVIIRSVRLHPATDPAIPRDDDRPRRSPRDDDDDDRPRSRRDEDGEDEDRPRRRRRRDDDDDDYDWERPRRAKKKGSNTLVIIIGALVGLVLLCGIGGFFLIFPAVSKVRDAAGRAKDSNNLKQIGLGMHSYYDANGATIPATGALSWRVQMLPYIEQQSLHRQFDPDQPWDSPKNRPHANVVVPTYHSGIDAKDDPRTRYRVFVGPGTIYEPGKPPRPLINGITDGTANTIFAAEAAETVPWPQPKELEFQQNGPLPQLGHPDRGVVLLAMCDGSVRAVDKKKLDPGLLRALITPAGGEMVPKDW